MNKKLTIGIILIAILLIPCLVMAATYLDKFHSAVTARFENLTVDTGATIAGLKNTLNVVDYTSTTTARTITAAESGTVFVVSDNDADETSFTLPSAAAGLTYTFIDGDAAAGSDLWIKAASGDTINGGTAAKSYKCTGDAVKQSVTIVAINAVRWEIVAEEGTWSNDNN